MCAIARTIAIQVFRKDGTFVKEAFVAKDTLGSGSVWDIAFSVDPAQTLSHRAGWDQSADLGAPPRHLTGRLARSGARDTGPASSTARTTSLRMRSGNLYITETYEGKRVQKFVYKGLGPATPPIIP